MHADLVVLGYDGSYGRVAAFVRAWKAGSAARAQTSGRGHLRAAGVPARRGLPVRLERGLGDLGGERTKLQVAHIKLSHSRAFIVRAYLLQTHEMLFDALAGVPGLGGVPQRGIFDNMKTAVDRIGSGKARQVNARFAGDGQPLPVRARVLQSGAGWEKGQVEKNVQDARRGCGSRCPASPISRR
jgi:transposase